MEAPNNERPAEQAGLIGRQRGHNHTQVKITAFVVPVAIVCVAFCSLCLVANTSEDCKQHDVMLMADSDGPQADHSRAATKCMSQNHAGMSVHEAVGSPFSFLAAVGPQALLSRLLNHSLSLYVPFTSLVWELSSQVKERVVPSVTWPDLQAYFVDEPAKARVYMAAMATVPRSAVLWAWWHDFDSTYQLLRTVDVKSGVALREVFLGMRKALARLAGFEAGGTKVPVKVSSIGKGLSSSFWVLWALCPSLKVAYYALAFADIAPISVAWVLLLCVVRVSVEVKLIWAATTMVMTQTWLAAATCLMLCYGLPYLLACHVLVVLNVAGWILSPPAFDVVCYYYSMWSPFLWYLVMLVAVNSHVQELVQWLRNTPGGALENPLQAEAPASADETVSRESTHWPPALKISSEVQDAADEAPKYFLCPITHHIMTQPAMTQTGASYERSAITEWLLNNRKDPLTNRDITSLDLAPNLNLYGAIEDWVERMAKAGQ